MKTKVVELVNPDNKQPIGQMIRVSRLTALSIIRTLSNQLFKFPGGVNSGREEYTTVDGKYLSFAVVEGDKEFYCDD
jgi:hypothetical protein